ncbi:multidrug effflux MFS transporter [Marinobacterium lutimaris]|uniref:Bcr/CflA family efflux transporter n=1 Tax=Marinobacterium lutimaris TaxID=568106 RepID=A0A1H5V9J3_9GAMM|nr:multidrug effflux MFS transporter [Marinobacterium lutimaris]SEF83883.1 MFS transporter, DHA1 family, bicyclomycin/chloramphenicol resistance protein [Marinobacterium lutimaris]
MSKSSIPVEFLLLMATMMCLTALFVDSMLPALHQIGSDLDALDNNRYQMVLTSIMVGLGVGQLFYGPIADAFGRKPAVYLGLALMLVGTAISTFAQSFEAMLFGRVLQGVGAAGPRVMVVTIIRDQYSGAEMARVLSLVMTIFIFSPVVAPLVGQVVLLFAGWRAIFGLLGVICLALLAWFAMRQVETLKPEHQRPLSLKPVMQGMKEVVSHRVALAYILVAGLSHSSIIAFLTSVQGIMQGIYDAGAMFPVYFAIIALGVGFSSFINSRLVYRFEIRTLVTRVLMFLGTLSLIEAALVTSGVVEVSLAGFIMMMTVSTFCLGLLFGNINALAMEPFGHMAGIASGVIGASTMLIGVLVGGAVGMSFNGTIIPLLLGFGLTSVTSVALILFGTPKQVTKAAAVKD